MKRCRRLLDAGLAVLHPPKPSITEGPRGFAGFAPKFVSQNAIRTGRTERGLPSQGRCNTGLCTAAIRKHKETLSPEFDGASVAAFQEDLNPNDAEQQAHANKEDEDEVALDNARDGVERTVMKVLPKVMIVGRPNVGKSALFNRLIKKREALVYNTPDAHVTRDVREGIAKLGDLRFVVADTAGLETDAEPENVLARTAGLTAAALKKCQIALFLVDARAGLQSGDFEIGKWLRRHAPHVRVQVLLNKAEGIHNDVNGAILATLAEAHALGFGDPLPVSAETGEGLSEMFNALQPWMEDIISSDILAEDVKAAVEPHQKIPLQLAIAGRPNVGKSTLVNALLRQERVLTGSEPGLTRDAVRVEFEYEGEKVYLIDTAGWLQRSRLKEGPPALSAMHARDSIMRAHVVALVLDAEEIVASRKTLMHTEAALAQWVVEEGRGLVVVVNKMDLLAGAEKAKLRKHVMEHVPKDLNFLLPQIDDLPVIFASAKDGKGQKSIMKKVLDCYERWCTRLSTAQLNKWLQKVVSRHPRVGGGHGPKVRYMTQVKSRPPTFVVFLSGVRKLQATEIRFFVSAIREDFKLGGIPVRVLQRNNSRGVKSP